MNQYRSSVCKRCREETRGGHSRALLCGESNLAKSLFSAMLVWLEGSFLSWGMSSWCFWVPSVGLSWFGSRWAPRGSGGSPSSAPVPAAGASSGNRSETKPTPPVSHLHPLKRSEKFKAVRLCSRIPSGFWIPRQPPANISRAWCCCAARHWQRFNGMFFCSGLLGVSVLSR